MELGGSKSREITSREEIYEVLMTALMRQWSFSYLTMVRNHLSSHATRLFSINEESDTITVSGDVLDTLTRSNGNKLYFHARNGGQSVVFSSVLVPPNDDITLIGKPKVCRFRFPESLRFSEKRKAIRIDLSESPEIRFTLFVNLGVRYQGRVEDISETGAKIQFEGNLAYQLSGAEIVTDCQMFFPDNSCIENRVRVRGVEYNSDTRLSTLRVEYVETNLNSEAQIKSLITNELDKLNQTDLAMAV